MTVPGNIVPLLMSEEAAAGYQISRSLRFNSADSAYLSRTPGSAGNRKTYTFSCWLKRSKLGTLQYVIQAYGGGTYRASLFFDTDDTLYFALGNTSPAIRTNAVFRDVSAWYHIVLAIDTTQSTQSAGMKLYVNGTQQTVTNSGTYTQNDEGWINSTSAHQISGTSGYYLDGYLADIYFLDGTATTPSTFAETDAITGQWVPKTPTSISYGTNGFRLTFSDNSGTTSTTLGKDAAGSNNWTPNNFSVASGSGNDSLVDSPTSYGTSTGVGGEVRGNYATLNPLINPSGDTFSNGNLQVTTSSSNYGTSVSTIAAPSSGKWYAEVTITATATYAAVGICSTSSTFTATSWIGSLTGVTYYGNTGNKYINGTGSSYGATFGLNDVIGIAYDADNLQITFYKNGSSQGTITGVTAGTYYFGGSEWDPASGTQVWNFGQRAFAYTAPSGFKALCDTNLTAPVVAKPSGSAFDVVTYTGSTSNYTVNTAFVGDLVWIKERSAGSSHFIYDAVRGGSNSLTSNNTNAETNVKPITINSSSVVIPGNVGSINDPGQTYVGWIWDAGTSTVANTQGSITSSVRANTSAGFSVLTATTPTSGSSFSVGHGLGVAPAFAIFKDRGYANSWGIYHKSITTTTGGELLFTTAAAQNYGWFPSAPTSTTFTLSVGGWGTGASIVGYLWTPVAGYSSFGSYTGNGSSTDGPFVFTGHRSRWLMVKRTDVSDSWYIYDTARNTYNVSNLALYAQSSLSEQTETANIFDVLSNGFKVRGAGGGSNVNGGTYIWASFAESPFQYARAR